jgi:hypothetical protein
VRIHGLTTIVEHRKEIAMKRAGKLVWLASLILASAPLPAAAQAQAPAAPPSVSEQRFADGKDWQSASPEERQAFLFGIANVISVAIGWDARHVPEGQTTFSRRARDGLAGVSLAEAVQRVDAWYAANPGRLETPVVAVLWLDIAKPKLQGRK